MAPMSVSEARTKVHAAMRELRAAIKAVNQKFYEPREGSVVRFQKQGVWVSAYRLPDIDTYADDHDLRWIVLNISGYAGKPVTWAAVRALAGRRPIYHAAMWVELD